MIILQQEQTNIPGCTLDSSFESPMLKVRCLQSLQQIPVVLCSPGTVVGSAVAVAPAIRSAFALTSRRPFILCRTGKGS